jgi:hypothetical protein
MQHLSVSSLWQPFKTIEGTRLHKSVGELLPSEIEGLVQDGHLQNAHASLLQACMVHILPMV